MFQQFNQSNSTTAFIKSLLSKTNIPMIPFITPGMQVIKGNYYIIDNYIVKAVSTGVPLRYVSDYAEATQSLITNYDMLENIEPYIFGNKYDGITTTFTSNLSYYDSDTHYWLGQYLRTIRGQYKLNLMPFYNCFNNNYLSDIKLSSDGTIEAGSTDNSVQILSVPIRFNQQYTIALQAAGDILVQPLFYGNKGLSKDSALTDKSNILKSSRISKSCSSFDKPFIFPEVLTEDNDLYRYEKFLRLAIQVPKGQAIKIIVLEGNYTNKCWNFSNLKTGGELLSPLSLLQLPPDNPVAFSDRLIEYLVNNVITDSDDISQDISRIQMYASSDINNSKNKSKYAKSYIKGVWESSLQWYLYELMFATPYAPNLKLDLNGFVDKDIETIITRGQNV